VPVWRELRRLSEAPDGVLRAAFEAAYNGDWAGFIRIMGGATSARKTAPIRLATVWNDKPNRYDEPTGEQTIGVEYGGIIVSTRIQKWTVGAKRPLEFCQ